MQCHSVKNKDNISIENFIQKGQYRQMAEDRGQPFFPSSVLCFLTSADLLNTFTQREKI